MLCLIHWSIFKHIRNKQAVFPSHFHSSRRNMEKQPLFSILSFHQTHDYSAACSSQPDAKKIKNNNSRARTHKDPFTMTQIRLGSRQLQAMVFLLCVLLSNPASLGADGEHFLNKQNTPSPSHVGSQHGLKWIGGRVAISEPCFCNTCRDALPVLPRPL